MSRMFKILSILNLIILSVIVIGCSKNVKEKTLKNLAYFRVEQYSVAMSSVPGLSIELSLDEANFLCETTNGSFTFNDEVKSKVFESGEEFYWCPHFKQGLNQSVVRVEEDSYVDVKILIDSQIIGYAVVKINCSKDDFLYTSKLLVSKIFVDMNGDYQSVSEEYVNQRIQKHHKWWK